MSGVYQVELLGEDESRLYPYVDPGTGEVLGDRGDPYKEGFNGWMANLHFYLFAGEIGLTKETGIKVVSVVGMVLFFILVTGIYLWWPGLRRWALGFKIRLRRDLVVGEACAGTAPEIWEVVEEELLEELAELELFLLTGESLVRASTRSYSQGEGKESGPAEWQDHGRVGLRGYRVPPDPPQRAPRPGLRPASEPSLLFDAGERGFKRRRILAILVGVVFVLLGISLVGALL